jgi:hypothetical protein
LSKLFIATSDDDYRAICKGVFQGQLGISLVNSFFDVDHVLPRGTRLGRFEYTLVNRENWMVNPSFGRVWMRNSLTGVLLALVAFGAYALAVLWLHTAHRSTWRLEQSGPLPIAASYLYYGTPLGAIDGGLWEHIFTRAFLEGHEGDAESFLAEASRRAIPTKPNLPTSIDGSGFGYARFATSAFFLLGPHTQSLLLAFIAVLGVSMLTFLLRFRDGRLLSVSILFSALTFMLLTPFATDQSIVNVAPIAGYRFFVVAGILPTMHIILELLDAERLHIRNAIWLAIQLSVLLLAASVRLSAAYFLLAAGIAATVAFAKVPRLHVSIKIVVLLLAGAVTYAIGYATTPTAYIELGLTSDPPWHRAIVGFGVNPAWPFGNLSERVNCRPDIANGMPRGVSDHIGHCFYIAAVKEGAPQSQTYSADYERILRRAFFRVLHDYPKEALETYVIYKPAMIWGVLSSAKMGASDLPIVVIASVQVLILLLSIWFIGTTELMIVAAAFALIVTASVVPPLIAWGSLPTAPDLICYKFIAVFLLLAAAFRLFRPKDTAREFANILQNQNDVGSRP